MLEKFSPEEIAQIKRELGMKADVWTAKENEYRPIREKNLQMALDEWNGKNAEGSDEE